MNCLQLNENFRYAFGTILFEADVPEHPEINPELAALVRARRDADPLRPRCAVDAWQSAPDLGAAGGPALEVLNRHIGGAALSATAAFFEGRVDLSGASVRGEIWGNIYGHCDDAAPHDHAGTSHWSGIYVVDAGDPPPEGSRGGDIRFESPPGVALPGFGAGPYRRAELHVTVRPRDGLFLLFPSLQRHLVHPYRGTRERITLAFNVVVDFGDGAAGLSAP